VSIASAVGRSTDVPTLCVIDATWNKREQKDGELEMGLVKELYFEMKERGLTLTLKQYMEMKNNEKDNDNRSRWNR